LAVGFAAARQSGRSAQTSARARTFAKLTLFGALSLAPDLDVIGFRLGIPYSAPFGHRGALHSLVVALAVSVVVALWLARGGTAPFGRSLAAVATAIGSHGFLDTLTDGGLGVALLWPFSEARFFAPWRPIPVAPIGSRILSAHGVHILAVEAILFAPVLLFAFWPRRPPCEKGDAR
jgi:inner membrane protein